MVPQRDPSDTGDVGRTALVPLSAEARSAAERDLFEQECYEANRHAAYLARVTQDRELQLRRLEDNNAELQALLAAAILRVDELELLVALLKRSTSWRLTGPLRRLRLTVNAARTRSKSRASS